MEVTNFLSADRKKYWENRLSKICFRCKLGLQSYQDSVALDSMLPAIYRNNDHRFIYRNEACGHQLCYSCNSKNSNYIIRCCDICNNRTVFEKHSWSFSKDLEEYVKETHALLSSVSREKDIEALEQKHLAESFERENEELKSIVDEKDREQSILKEEISILTMKLDAVKKEEGKYPQMVELNIDTHCMECGYAVIFERSRICVSCGIEKGFISKQNTEEGKEELRVVSFDKAEISLLCGSCILEGAHENHTTVNYFKLKANQLSVSHKSEITHRLNNTFNEGWDTVCQKINQCHLPIVEILTKRDEEKMKQDSWEEFKKTQLKESSIVQRMTESKTNMVGHMHKYTGDMKALLIEAQTLLQDAKKTNDPDEQAVVEAKKEIEPAEQVILEDKEN